MGTDEMAVGTKFLRDHLGRELQPGRVYAIRRIDEPPTRAKICRVVAIIRETAYVAEGGGDRTTRRISNLEACGLQFIACNEAGAMLGHLPAHPAPPSADSQRERIRAAIRTAGNEAARIRAHQAALMERLLDAIGDDVSQDFIDAMVSFVRDEPSHISEADLVALAMRGQ